MHTINKRARGTLHCQELSFANRLMNRHKAQYAPMVIPHTMGGKTLEMTLWGMKEMSKGIRPHRAASGVEESRHAHSEECWHDVCSRREQLCKKGSCGYLIDIRMRCQQGTFNAATAATRNALCPKTQPTHGANELAVGLLEGVTPSLQKAGKFGTGKVEPECQAHRSEAGCMVSWAGHAMAA